MIQRVITLALVALAISGCSSIVSKSHYPVSINSTPDGAKYVITNRDGHKVDSGVTPATVTMKSSSGYFKGETYTILMEKDGFELKTYVLTSTIDGWYWGNILLGGLVGMLIVDPATGAMYNLPDRADVSLDMLAESSSSQDTVAIATIDSLTAEQLTRLVSLK